MTVSDATLNATTRWRRAAVGVLAITGIAGAAGVTSGWRASATFTAARRAAPLPVVVVYKDPGCGCCRAWVDRMRAAGFPIEIHDVPSAAARDAINRAQGVTPALAACHTAVVGGYVVEGHVPPELVVRMLTEHPKIAGLAVPGMPSGSPGMEGMGSEHYDVLAFNADGTTRVYAQR